MVDQGTWADAETRDIGVGGAFVFATEPLPIGTPVVLMIAPGGDRQHEVPGLVRWVADGPGQGMGIQFVKVDIDVMLELNEYFARLATEA